MKFSELPTEIQERLMKDRLALKNKNVNTPYEIRLYNEMGTRYFIARRCVHFWNDHKGHYMPFGGGSEWVIRYGMMSICRKRTPAGTFYFELVEGKLFRQSANGTVIPKCVQTKAEVLEIVKNIGIFNL